MVELIKRKDYYYLGHSVKDKGKVFKEELYLGKKIPSNLDQIKAEFMVNLLTKRYKIDLEKIKRNFSNELKAMPKEEKEKYLNYFMIKFTYDSTRIEGSTLTLKETADLLEEHLTPKNRPISDVKEAEKHKKVFYQMIECKKLDLDVILKWHKDLLLETQDSIAGQLRRSDVRVARSKSKFPPHQLVLNLLKEFFIWYNENKTKLHPLILASLVHLKFVSIHPFADGNGRISRLLMNYVLHKSGYPMLNIKYSDRGNYYNSLERSQVKKEEYPFLRHLLKRYLTEYDKYLK
jgi:Fic family protein